MIFKIIETKFHSKGEAMGFYKHLKNLVQQLKENNNINFKKLNFNINCEILFIHGLGE